MKIEFIEPPEKTKKRDRRDRNVKRKKRAIRMYKDWDYPDPEFHAQRYNDMVPCSKECCGNPRRHRGEVTRQETKADLKARELGLKR